MTISDQAQDSNGRQLFTLLKTEGPNGEKLYEPPDFVKKASREAFAGGEGLSPNVFGNPATRQFPCHTAAATWVSALFFHGQKEASADKFADIVEKRIDAAAAHYGIRETVEAVKKAAASSRAYDESALPDEDYALVYKSAAGTERMYPLRNEIEVKTACAYLKEHASKFSFADRKTIAEKILTKSASSSADVSGYREFLEVAAGRGTCSVDTVATYIFKRAQVIKTLRKDLAAVEALAKMAAACLAQPADAVVPSRLWKVASIIEQVDRDYKIAGLKDLPPTSSLFQLNAKIARDMHDSHFATTSGSVYSKADMASVSPSEIESFMGSQFGQEVTDGLHVDPDKMAAVASTLPRPDAELFDRLMSRCSVSPVHKTAAAAVPSGFLSTPERLREMAALHGSV